MSTRLWPYLLLVLGLVLIGCGGGGDPTATPTTTPLPTATPTLTPTVTAETTGTLEVRVTDLPNPAIEIVAEQVQVHSASTGEWMTVVEGPVSFDLIALGRYRRDTGSSSLPPGEYTQVRLSVTAATR